MTLITIPDIQPNIFRFPGGEPHCSIGKPEFLYNNYIQIFARINSFNDLGELFILVDVIKRHKPQHICLIIPYFPGARQDRITSKRQPFTCKIYCELINNLKLDQVRILDPHSDVVLALLNNVEVISIKEIISTAIIDFDPNFLISPDAGSSKKIHDLNYLNLPVIQCGKIREVVTGKLSGFEVFHNGSLAGHRGLIIDDICDGGGTFVGLAKKLKEKSINSIGLYVTHGIFSKGVPLANIDKIYTTNSIRDIEETDSVKVLNIVDYLY